MSNQDLCQTTLTTKLTSGRKSFITWEINDTSFCFGVWPLENQVAEFNSQDYIIDNCFILIDSAFIRKTF